MPAILLCNFLPWPVLEAGKKLEKLLISAADASPLLISSGIGGNNLPMQGGGQRGKKANWGVHEEPGTDRAAALGKKKQWTGKEQSSRGIRRDAQVAEHTNSGGAFSDTSTDLLLSSKRCYKMGSDWNHIHPDIDWTALFFFFSNKIYT